MASLGPTIGLYRRYEAVAKGREFATITIALGSRQTFTLHVVIISSISLGNGMSSLDLSFTAMDFKLAE